MSSAVFLPQGVAAASPDTLDGASCAQRDGCPPRPHDGADRLFVGPVLGSHGSARATASPSGSSVAGTRTTGSATAGTAAEAAATSGVSGAAANSGTSGASGATDAATGASASGSAGTGSSGSKSGSSGGDSSNSNSSKSNSSNSSTSNDDSGSTSGSSGSSSSADESADGSSSSASHSSASDSSASESSSSSATSSPADSSAGTTSAGTDSGAAPCPGTAGTGTPSSAADSATGSVTTGTAAPATTAAAASVPNVTGAALGTATSATAQALAATPGIRAPVAGTAVNEASAAGSANLPGDVIDLAPWYLTLPTGKQGSPDTVENPALAKFTNDFFKLNNTRNGVVFSARGDGVTTKNSKYPRSELREMNGSEKAAWSNTTGSHTLDVCEAINKVPSAKPEVVGAQIHDAEDDVLQIRLEGQTLMVQYNDGKSETVIDPAYKLGTPYNIRIVAADSKVDVLYNGQQKAELPLKGSGWYWKVGAYVQSNASKGDADSVGEVTVYSLKCVHA